MPTKLVPTHASVIVLYGHEACERFASLAEYWDLILEGQAWGNFLFILIDRQQHKPRISQSLEMRLSKSCWWLPMDLLCSAGRPLEIFEEIRRRIQNNTVSIQCVCSLSEKELAPPEDLICWLDGLHSDFKAENMQMITYMVMHDLNTARASQMTYGKAFHARKDLFPYLYLLSDCAADGSLVTDFNLWRALFGELLANSATHRVLAGNTLYSLGFSSLNANDSELISIRQNLAATWLLDKANQPLTMQDAWSLLMQSDIPFPGKDTHELRLILRTWLESVISRRVSIPDITERKNNRLLSLHDNLAPEEIHRRIQQFYDLNCGSNTTSEAAARQFAQHHMYVVYQKLRRTINAQGFPLQLITRIREELTTLSQETSCPRIPPWQPRRVLQALLPSVRQAHFDQYCKAVEADCERMLKVKQTAIYAKAIASSLVDFRSFVEAASNLASVLGKSFNPLQDLAALEKKYGRYVDHADDVIKKKPERLTLDELDSSFYDMKGNPDTESWREAVEVVSKKLMESLPKECSGSFCETVCWAYGAKEGLNDFLSKYLIQSKRMLFEPNDTPGEPQQLYYTDLALAAHPWFQTYDQTVIIARNDNVERLDLFRLQNGFDWYLKNNRSFQPEVEISGDISGLEPVFEPKRTGEQSIIDEKIESSVDKEWMNSQPVKEEINAHNLAIHIDKSRYVLTWDWDTTAPNAMISIHQDGMLVGDMIPCSVEEYNLPVGNIPSGIDITDNLPYGRVRICISSDTRLYACKEIHGRQNMVRYRFDIGKEGVTLLVQGASSDICKLVLYAPRESSPERTIVWPLYTEGDGPSFRFTGLYLRDSARCRLQASPEDRFPTVYAVRG